MATGYLVTLGPDGLLGVGDSISGSPTTFTEDGAALAVGSWQWTGVWTGNGVTYNNITDTGVYWLGTDGNTYFIPDTWTISSGSATVTAALDGTVDGTAGDDVIDGAYTGDPGGEAPTGAGDTIDAGDGNDTVRGGGGDDTVYGGSGNDSITGETGDDSVSGGAGDDLIRGDQSAGAGRSVFQWSGLPDPDDGGTIDDGDALTATATQDTGGTTVTYTYTANPAGFPDGTGGTDTTPEFKTLDQYTAGIDAGGAGVDNNSSLWIGGDLASSMGALDFTDPVTNVSFRVNDIDTNPGGFTDRVTIRAYDENGAQITVNLTGGANITLADTDGVAGNDQATSAGSAHSSADADASILVDIPGPVSRIEIIYSDISSTGDDGLVNVTDVYFDEFTDPIGNDTLAGDAGNDTIYGEGGNDTLDGGADTDTLYGGEGSDTIYGDGFTVDTSGGNLIQNGNFEDTTGMTATGFGFVGTGSVPGWTSSVAGDPIDFHNDGKGGINGSDGANMLESAGTPNNLDVYQDVSGLTAGQTYQLTLDAGDADADGDSRMEVYFGGELIGIIDPANPGTLDSYTFNLTGGAGDGSDRLQLVEVGNNDNDGMMLDNVQLYPTTPTVGGAADSIEGGAGDDLIYGEAGADTIDGGTGGDTAFGGDGADSIGGNDGTDQLFGGAGADTVDGGADADDLSGGAGNDTILGGGGDDTGFGGTGDDTLDGGDNSDTLYGGAGNDSLTGGEDLGFGDDDTLFGGDGNDTLFETETNANSNDVMHGDAGNDTISSNQGVDTLYGGADRDTLLVSDISGADIVEGGEGGDDFDVLDGSGLTLDATVDISAPEAGTMIRNGETVTFSEIEMVVTGSGDDSVSGSTGDDTITTGSGSDTVDAGQGDDVIDLGAGSPDGDPDLVVFSDGDGSDVISNFDAPTPNGDGTFTGTDLLDVSALTDADGNPVNTHDVTVTDDGSGNAVLTFPGLESITLIGISPTDADDPYYLNAIGIPIADGTVEGSAGADTIDAGYLGDPDGDRVDADDVIIPGHGANDDLVLAYGGADSITTGDGNDTVYGGTGNDTIDGGADADTIFGGDDADVIFGGGGDTIDGGEGGNDNDTLNVAGVDRIDYDPADTENGTVYFSDGTTLDFTNIETVVVAERDGTVSGTAGNDVIDAVYVGDPDGDIVDNNDAILPGDANNDDLIEAGAGDDTVIAGDGNDEIYAGSGNDSVTGDAGNDTIFGEGGTDTLSGGAGSDTIYGGGTIMGGGDNDFLFIFPGAPSSTVYGGTGDDLLSDAGVQGDLAVAGSGNDNFTLNAGNDTIVAGTGNDTVAGGDADDMFWVENNFGVDIVTGGETLETNGDILDAGTNTYLDEEGDPVTTGVTVDTTLTFTGSEAGTLSQNSNPSNNTITFTEIERVRLGSGDDTVYGGVGNDDVIMGDGDDTFFLNTGFGADTITGGEGGESVGDQIDSSAVSADTTVDFSASEAGTITDGVDTATFSEIEEITTGAGDDTVLGDVGNDRVNTGAGNDTLLGGAGNDVFDAGAGNDTLDGEAGNDTLLGGDGDDTFVVGDASGSDNITGGEGAEVAGGDTIDATSQTTNKTLQLNSDGAGVLIGDGDFVSFSEIENIDLGSGNDFVNALSFGGTANVDTGAGNDTYGAGAGDDTAVLGTGNDTLNLSNLTGTDTIEGGENAGDVDRIDAANQTADLTVNFTGAETGTITNGTGTATFSEFERITTGSGDDTIIGDVGNDYIITLGGDDTASLGAGDDTIFGGTGNDTFDGGAGNDSLTGGDDRDTFVYSDGFGDDTVDGGSGGDNYDTIDLSGLSNSVTVVFTGPGAGTVTDDVTGETITFTNIERVITTNQADTIDNTLDDGSTRIDTLDATDTVTGSTGNEEIYLGGDADTMTAGDGNDTIYGEGGDDSLRGSTGDDTLYGGAGNDILVADNNTGLGDELYGGDGNDTLVDSFFNSTLDGGAGADTFEVGTGDATIFGGETGVDQDVLDFTAADDRVDVTLNGDESGTYADDEGDDGIFQGIEEFELSSGNDTFDGSAATTAGATVIAGAGDDSLTGGGGADSFDAGAGNDTLTFSDGDTVSGGAGNDTFVLTDTTGGPGATITVDGGSGDETGAGDTLQLGDLANLQDVLANAVDDGTGSYSGSVTLDDGTILNFSEIENIICFTPGTRIATPQGARDIADLRVGDLVVTRDHGLQPIRWIQSRTVPAMGRFAPIRIRPGVVTGQDRDLLVSPQHRMLFQGYRAELLFGETEVLVAAKHLVDGTAVTQDAGGDVTYIHMMFDEHEVVYAEGAATESFHPGSIGLSAIADAARDELFTLFPELRSDVNGYGDTARRCLKRHEAELLRV